MILIFNFSAMNGEVSHVKSRKIVKSVIVNRIVIPTTETTEDVVSIDKQESFKKNELNKEEKVKKQRMNRLVGKYDDAIRKLAHVLEYFVLILLMMNFIFQVIENKKFMCYVIGIVLCILYAGLDELHQSHVSGRNGQAIDVLVDSVGIVIGAVVMIVVQWIRGKLRKEKV